MGRRSFMSPVLLVAFIIGLGIPIAAYYTTEDYPRQFSAGYSDVSIENGYYGRLYVSHYEHGYTRSEVCTSGFNRYEGETLCQYHGYSYNTYTAVSPRNSHNTVSAYCSPYRYGSYNFCDIRRLGYCSQVVYLQCYESSTFPYGWWTRDTQTTETTETRETSTQQQFSVGYSDVTLEYGTYGRVYIRHYQYGYDRYEVCSDGFSSTDGEALCQSKGYSYSSFSTTSPRNYYHTVATNCYYYNIYNCNIQTQSYCSRAVYLYCSGSTTISTTNTQTTETTETRETSTQQQFSVGYSDVTLEYGTYGRVYIRHYQYGYDRYEVCSDGFSSTDGEALCQSKGYSYSSFSTTSPRNYYHTVTTNCYYNNIYNCNIRTLSYCSRAVDLYCSGSTTTSTTDTITTETTERETSTQQQFTVGYSDVTLEYGTYGRVYIRHYQYGYDRYEVCSDGFSSTDGEALCQSKGYSYSSFSTTSPRNYYHTVTTNCYYNNIYNCNIRTLSYCLRAVDLYCWGSTTILTTSTTSTTTSTTQSRFTVGYTNVRLVGSGYSDRGTIEVYLNGQWGTICDDQFNKTDGDVICRMLGFNSSRNIFGSAHYGTGNGPILYQLNCNGYETDIAECGFRDWGTTGCSHYEDAGVDCGDGDEYETTSMSYGTCYSRVCYNGGTCIAYNNGYPGYYCNCPSGFTGLHCQNDATTYDACYPNPCQNGATCSKDYYYSRNYYCSCPRGYSGQNCEYYVGYYETTSYDPCYSHNPCYNGGTCYHNYGYPGYHCSCPSGYSGRNCDSYNGFSIEGVITVGCNENNWNVAVYLPPLYSRYPDFNPGDLYLGQDSCTGYVDGNFLRFQSDYTTCSTESRTSRDNIAHTNEIIYAVHDPNHHFIVREYRFRVPVDCFLPRNEESSNHYYHGHITIPPAHHVTGSTHHTVYLRFYTDSSFQHPKSLYGSKVGDTVYVKAFTDVRDYNQKMRLSDCYTTPTSSPYSSLKYFIIQNGCVIDPNARILSQNTHETRFYFQDFEYSTNQNSLYLHCNATFCKSNDYSAACEQTCHHKRLGGGNVVFDGPVESFDVNDAVRLTSDGPAGNGNKIISGHSTLLVVISLVFGGVILAMTISIIVGMLKKRMRQKRTEVVKDI